MQARPNQPQQGHLLELYLLFCLVISKKFGKTADFCDIHIFPFQVSFTIVVKTVRATLEFINVHLQQCDHVASILRTVYL